MTSRHCLGQTRGRQMLAATGCSPTLLEPAWEYMRIRALAMPAALMLMIAQARLPLLLRCLLGLSMLGAG